MHDEKESPVLTSVTSTHLLEGLREPDNRTVWQQFDSRYRPVIRGYAVLSATTFCTFVREFSPIGLAMG